MVKRYNPWGWQRMEPSSCGEWVSYKDYMVLRDHLRALDENYWCALKKVRGWADKMEADWIEELKLPEGEEDGGKEPGKS